MKFIVLLACFVLSTNVFASGISSSQLAVNTVAFHEAEEDYRFGDFEVAIPKLEALHRQYPQDATIVQYLTDSYTVLERFNDALSLYGKWLLNAVDKYGESARFAWLGMSNVLLKLQKKEAALHSLEQWVTYHPDDYVASTMYGGLLVRSQRYEEANKIWRRIVAEAGSSDQDKAAAYYFQSLYAYLQGDLKMQKHFAEASLKSDPEGGYSALSKKLLTARPSRVLGFHVNFSLEQLYTSNVELLPDFQLPVGNKKKTDMVTQINATLSHNFTGFSLAYLFSEGFHATRKDLNMAYHSVYGMWRYDGWSLSPRYEFVQLGGIHPGAPAKHDF